MCLRFNLPTNDGRGVDSLPIDLKTSLEAGLVRSLEPEELCRAFEKTMDVFMQELGRSDKELYERLFLGLKSLIEQVKDLLQ